LTVEDMISLAIPGSLFPRLVSTDEGTILMSWLVPTGSEDEWELKFSEWNSKKWSKPQTIFKGNRFFVNWADFPSIYQVCGDTLAAHWLTMAGEGAYEYNVNVSFSYYRGKNWTAPEIPHKDGVLAEHGFLSFFTTGDGIGMAWLDGRNMMMDEEENVSGAMNLISTTYSDGKWTSEKILDDRVCECCPTASLQMDDNVIVAYRDRNADEIRNMSIVKFENNGWSSPITVNEDNWKIPGCPVNGPVLAGNNESMAVGWFTAPMGNSQVNVTFSKDGGDSFGKTVRVDSGNPMGRVDLEWLGDGKAIVSWIESVDEKAELMIRVIHVSGKMELPHSISEISPSRGSGFPQIVKLNDNLIFAWTDPQEESSIIMKKVALAGIN